VNAAIDLLKALAIGGVLWQHTVAIDVTDDVFGNLWIRAAVPIFVVLMGFNLMASVLKRGEERIALGDYMRRRVQRLAAPFLLILAAGYVIGVATGDFDANISLLFFGLPINAPGNYFIPALIGLVALFPLLAGPFRRRPALVLAACFAVNAAFEVIVLSGFGKDSGLTNSLLYAGNPLRWLGAFALGMWIASDPRPFAARNRWLLGAGVLSAGYLLAEQLSPSSFDYFPNNFIEVTNLLAAPWAAVLTMAGLALLPRHVSRRFAWAPLIGAASYHIYLVQMIVIGVIVGGLAGALLSIGLGIAYFWILPPRLGGAREGPEWARRPWAAQPSTSGAAG
jgi:peptidoglycan/LPS O-acetylase OafA/YrhL